MDNPNRINPVSVAQTQGRQTPHNDFGQVLARTVGEVVHNGAAVVGGLAMGAPVVSTAVSSISATASAVVPVGTGAPGQLTVPAGGSIAAGPSGQGKDWDLLEAQKLMRSEDRRFNLEYLQLQTALQKESREFTAVSNIMKVRHDSAKAAINNIR
jgi:hypothetical protein